MIGREHVAGDTKGSIGVFEDSWQDMRSATDSAAFGPLEALLGEVKNEALAEILPPGPTKMLECGCGTAEVSAFFAMRGYRCTLLDASPAALDLAQRRFDALGCEAEFIQGNVYEMPVADDAFDVVSSFGLLEHFEDPNRVISEMVRTIRPTGLLFADIVPKRFSVDTIGRGFNAIEHLAAGLIRGEPREGQHLARLSLRPSFYENDYTFESYRGFFEQAGLVNIFGTGNRPFPLLMLPAAASRVYAALLRRALPLWRQFDASDARFTRWWGAGWWMWGSKPAHSAL